MGHRDIKGYGKIHLDGRTVRTHRLAWTLANGEDPGDLLICHKCDNPPCCNPAHLYAGTSSDNQRDRKNWRSGDGANRTRMTDRQVREARQRYVRRSPPGSGTSSADLAAEYGVTVPYLVRLLRGGTPRKVD
jgi:hypothetical protein